MSTNGKNDNPLGHLPDDLLERLRLEVREGDVRYCAAYDLDDHGNYVEGYLVLADGRLGEFARSNGQWRGSWRRTNTISEAKIVEGLGVNLLRLLRDGKAITEYRFTLRQARQVARLHRRLERQLEGKENEGEIEPEPVREDEKKLRCDKCGRPIPPWSDICRACMSRRKILFRLLDFVKPYKKRAIMGALLAAAGTSLALLQPILSKGMIDDGLGGRPGSKPDAGLFTVFVALLGGLTLVMVVVSGIRERLMNRLGAIVARTIRDAMYSHMHKLSLSFFSRKQTGSLVARVTSDSDRLVDFIAWTVVQVAVAFLTIVGGGVMMFVLNWRLAFFVLLPIPVMMGLTMFFHKKLHRFFGRIWHRWSQMTAVVAGALPGVRVIKAFSQEDREVRRFGSKNEAVYTEQMKMISTWTIFGPVMQFCAQLSVLIIWIVGGAWLIGDFYTPPLTNAMTFGTLIAFMGYMAMFSRPIHMIAHIDRMFNRAATSAQRIFEILDLEPAIFTKKGAHRPDEIEGRIELRGVSFSYDGIRRVIKDVSLTVAPGEMIGLAGPSGGGKTTLINLICRFYDVLEGQILIDGVDVRDYDLEHLRRRIGVVLQEPFLFHGTVTENIAYGNPDASLEGVIEAARAANAHDFIVGFPDGYDTIVGERGQSLSGGERQRISIARAILNNPRILILDEATSSVDTETEKLIQEALDRLVANRTTIAIAHRLSTLRKAHRLIILEKGKLIEQGTHEELLQKEDGIYAKLLRMQHETQSVMAIKG